MRLSALVPDATVNYVKNSSMRYDTTDWNQAGATLTRTLTHARFGIASLKVVTAGTALRQGAYYRVSALAGISTPITVSAYVRGAGRARIRLIDNPSGKEWASATIQLESDRWYRLLVSGFSTGSNDLRLYVETDERVATARTFYVDGAQMERKAYPTTYCDGDQPGCRWNGTAHNGTSQRDPFTRAGGRWVQLAGEAREAQDLYMTVAGGLGVAPITNYVNPFSLAPGSYFQNRKIHARPITLTFHAKRVVSDQQSAVSLAHLHQLRQLLIDIVRPGREEIWFEYDDGGRPLYFQARYEGGLEGSWDVRNQFVNSFPMRLLATTPLMREDSQDVQVLDFQDQVRVIDVIGRINGVWNRMNYGIGGTVNDLEFGSKGELVAAGTFILVNFDALAVAPFTNSPLVTYWDGEKWNAVGTGSTAGATINDVAIAPNGDIYVTGSFTSIGGVAANNIARWNGITWSALGSGLNSDGIHISIDSRGNLYVGGFFTTAGGVARNNIARWDGSSWRGLGQYNGLNADVFSIAISPDGDYLYVGGAFTDQNSDPGSGLNFVAYYDVATDRFSAVGNGFNANVLEVILAPSGVLYACGDFTLSGSDTIKRIGKFVGGGWVPLGSGMNNTVNSFDVGINGDIVAVGSFSLADNVVVRNIAFWNGSSWSNFDVEIQAGGPAITPLAVQYAPNGDVYIAGFFQDSVQSVFSGINYVTNTGSAEALPTIYILGPGRLRWIENQTTKKRVFFDLYIQPSEEVFIDFVRGSVFSTVRGDLFHAMLPGSDFHFFTLTPGENKIACFMVNDVGAQMQISFTPTHWGADAVMENPLEVAYA